MNFELNNELILKTGVTNVFVCFKGEEFELEEADIDELIDMLENKLRNID